MSPLAKVSDPFLLSDAGSTRATAYCMANKAVRVGSKTHVVWLDAITVIQARTYDHDSDTWSDVYTLGQGCDNHANPALSATPDGFLRVAYGPHTFNGGWNYGRFKLAESERPNDASSWRPLMDTGYNATYASLVTDAEGRDHLAYRGGGGPKAAMYERRLPNDAWERVTKLSMMRGEPRYTNVGNELLLGPDGVLYCGFHYYATRPDHSIGVCAIKSEDLGETWTALNGAPIRLPLDYDAAYAPPHVGSDPRLSSMTMGPDKKLIVVTTDVGPTAEGCLLSVYEDGEWRTARLDPFLPDGRAAYGVVATVDARGRLLVAVGAAPSDCGDVKRFGHPGMEVFLLASADAGESFEAIPVSRPSNDAANWLPSISRVGPNRDLSRPVILFTHGGRGEGCSPPDRTEVYAVWVD